MKKTFSIIASCLCISTLCFAQTATPNFKLELAGDANDFILNGRSLVHTNETANLYHDAEVDRLSFQIRPHNGLWGGHTDHERYNWTLIVERQNGEILRQGQYEKVLSHANNENKLIVSLHPHKRACGAEGNAEIRVIDTSTSNTTGTELNKFKIDFELNCKTHTPKLRGSFSYNWAGDEPFKLTSSNLRVSSRDTYYNYSFYERNLLDGRIHSFWLTNPNPSGRYVYRSLALSQTDAQKYALSHMKVIFYSDHYSPNWFNHSGYADGVYIAGWLPSSTFGRTEGYPSVSVKLNDLKLPRINLGFWGNQYFKVVREIEVFARPHYSRWKNQADHCDTNGDGRVTALDLLSVINFASRVGYNYVFPEDKPLSERFYDLNGDGRFSPIDLLIANNCMSRI